MILTVDLGTSVTKVGLWGDGGLLAIGRADVVTARPRPGWAEQDPEDWWRSIVAAADAARELAPQPFGSVEVVAFAAARQTFVPVTADGTPIGAAIVWSDRRARTEAEALATALGGAEALHARTGVPMEAGAVAPKLAWLAAHEPERLAAGRWLLAPRDLMVWRLTGEVVTDPSMARCMGLADLDDRPIDELAGPAEGRLAPIVPSDTVVGGLRREPAEALGLPAGLLVVIGAGDRQCEVLGSGAAPDRPMVSWGTTANVSVPLTARPQPVPARVMLSRSATGGWQVEAGLSAAGSWLDWLGRLVGRSVVELVELAAESPPGARGVVAASWLDGARAPWWTDDARGAFVGLGSSHDLRDVARAAIESVAWDVARSLDSLAGTEPFTGLALAGSGGRSNGWIDLLTAITALPASRRTSGEAASAGAAVFAARALGRAVDLDRLDPVIEERAPDVEASARYRELASAGAATLGRLVSLPLPPGAGQPGAAPRPAERAESADEWSRADAAPPSADA